LGYLGAGVWAPGEPGEHRRAERLARTYENRLGLRERVVLAAISGPRYPEPPQPRERIQAWEYAARQVADEPDVWTHLGDAYFHEGPTIGLAQPYRRAAEAFDRALSLDTALNIEPAIHLMQIAGMERDTAKVRRLVSRFPEDDPDNAYLRLEAGAVLGDSAMLSTARRTVDRTGINVGQLMSDALTFGFAIEEAEQRAAVQEVYLKRSTRGSRRWQAAFTQYDFYLQLGRPAAAARIYAQLIQEDAPPGPISTAFPYALYGYVDSTAAAKALARLAPIAAGPLARDAAEREEQYFAICGVEWWRLAHGDTRTVRAAIARLASSAMGCGVMLEALLAAAEHRPDADAAFGRLDSLIIAGGARPGWALLVARWREAQGDIQGALRATRQCDQYGFVLNRSSCLREHGRLAALAGDRTGAIQAYSHYLALRYNPEPSVTPEVDRVRADLAQLVGEPR
jgi:hypothetical protein